MFLWIKLLGIAKEGETGDTLDLISNKAIEKGVIAVPGVVSNSVRHNRNVTELI